MWCKRLLLRNPLAVLSRVSLAWGESGCFEEVAAFDECALRRRYRRRDLTLDFECGVSAYWFETRLLFLHAFRWLGGSVRAFKKWRLLMNLRSVECIGAVIWRWILNVV